MRHDISCEWTGDMSFEAQLMGRVLRMDASADNGGQDSGFRPKPLLLAALAGCSGMDVVSILRKMREPLGWFNIQIEGELAEEEPRRYTGFQVIYEFRSSDGLDAQKVRKAVELSQEKYCGVSATLKGAGPMTWEIRYL